VVQVFYGFGGALGKQFGAALLKNYNCQGQLSGTGTDSSGIRFHIGLWSPKEKEEILNYKELRNQVVIVCEETMSGRVKDCELFIFTNNSMLEGCFYQGNSKSACLYALVLELWVFEMTCGITIHNIHISKHWMIAQGTDGCLRGSMMEGVMLDQDMLLSIDLARTAVECHSPLLTWVCAWTDQPKLEPLTLEGWFDEGHGIRGEYLDKHKVWIPTQSQAQE
jgi:hypothetical protein